MTPKVRRAAVAVGLCCFAWAAGTYAPFSWQSETTVITVGGIFCVLAFSDAPRREAPRRVTVDGASYWVIATFAFFEWEVAAAVDRVDKDQPTLSEILDPVLDYHGSRAVAYALWVLAGWRLISR
jgi:hypothetical protein